jgi:7,8-dihydropterin-6-yl-methyl-4-(beta-D-ribofuranosyl)aminobenzene 5'-phosphate synthase
MKPTFFRSPLAFRAWLERHHEVEQELWVGFHKKSTGKASLSWPEHRRFGARPHHRATHAASPRAVIMVGSALPGRSRLHRPIGAPHYGRDRSRFASEHSSPERAIMRLRHSSWVILASLAALARATGATPAPGPGPADRITILYDAFGDAQRLKKDWGFAALVEYGGKRILFDTGNDPDVFAHNVKALGIDLKTIDFAVISHRHGDHTSGLTYLLRINPHVRIYAPREGFGVFGASLPGTFYRADDSLPRRMRYFDGERPAAIRSGTPWSGANFVWVDSLTEVSPGIFLISTVSQTPGTLELRELSLAINTPAGLVLLVGCSHPGIERIVQASTGIAPHVHLIAGGLHLVTTPDAEIARIVGALHDQWKVDLLAPGHCTGEPAFRAFQKAFGDHYVYAGLGTRVALAPPAAGVRPGSS